MQKILEERSKNISENATPTINFHDIYTNILNITNEIINDINK
jgi:hypothetical protein